jgi:hypothetical protein
MTRVGRSMAVALASVVYALYFWALCMCKIVVLFCTWKFSSVTAT